MEARDLEYKAWAHVQSLKASLDERNLESRVKTANEAEAISQQRLAAAEAEIARLRQKLEVSKRLDFYLTALFPQKAHANFKFICMNYIVPLLPSETIFLGPLCLPELCAHLCSMMILWILLFGQYHSRKLHSFEVIFSSSIITIWGSNHAFFFFFLFRDLSRLSDELKSKGDENVAYLSEIEVTFRILNY